MIVALSGLTRCHCMLRSETMQACWGDDHPETASATILLAGVELAQLASDVRAPALSDLISFLSG